MRSHPGDEHEKETSPVPDTVLSRSNPADLISSKDPFDTNTRVRAVHTSEPFEFPSKSAVMKLVPKYAMQQHE